MAQGDFELLSTYITIRTVGLEKVVAAFSKIKSLAADLQNVTVRLGGGAGGGMREASEAAERFKRQLESARLFMLQIQTSGRGVAQQLTALALLETRIRTLQTQQNLTRSQRIQLETLLNSVLTRQAVLQNKISREAQRAQAAANAAVNAGAARLNQLATALGNMQREVRQLMNSISLELGFAAPFLRLGTNVFRVSQSFRQLARVAGLGAGAIRLAGIAGGVLTVGLAAMNTALRIAGRLMATVARIAGSILKQAFNVLLGPTLALVRAIRLLAQNLPLLSAALGSVFVRSITQTAREFQRLTSLFQFAFGAQSQQQLQFVINLSRQLGVPLESIAENYARITAAARNAGIAQEDLQTLFQGTSAAAVALGLDTERINGLFFAFDQIISKGRLSAEELRRQIGDRLPGAFDIAAKAMGVTTEQLDKMLEQGQVSAKRFVSAFGPQLVSDFFEQALLQATRINAAIGLMRTEIFLAKGALAATLEPALVRVINRFTALIRRVSESAPFQRFALFVAQQINTIELNFDRIVAALRRLAQEWAPVFQRLGRIILVVNTVAIGGMIELFGRLRQRIEDATWRMESFVQALTGINIRGLGLNLNTVIAVAEAIPLIFDAMSIRIQLSLEKVRIFIGAIGRAMADSGSLIAKEVGKLFVAVSEAAETAMSSFSTETARSTELSEQLRLKWEEIGKTIQKSLDSTLAAQFTKLVEGAQERMSNLMVTAFRDLQLLAATPPSPATLQARQSIQVAAAERGQPLPVFSGTDMTGVEQGLQLTAQVLQQIRYDLDAVARNSITSALLKLTGGGLSR